MSHSCPKCGAEAPEGAKFCGSCGSSLIRTCPNCGVEVPSDARFCLSCGTPQETKFDTPPEAPHTAAREERKVITVLFADLVGFTSATEQADPEDARARLVVYHRLIREDVERHGGNIEKLMGDGAFAVFGAPKAHEDDPERAVRSALRIQDSVTRLNEENPLLGLSVRIAVTTGEAIVQLDRTDRDREGIIGDVVNTASRLEAVAEPGTVIVDERTHAGARATIEFAALDPVTVKGKSQPIGIWRAVKARSRLGVSVEEGDATPFVGRQSELDLLVTRFERSHRENTTEFVTIIGQPGVGKSRLVNEFRNIVDNLPEIVWWRQGHCLPYGEGITFWAIGEIVKAQAGILDSDPPSIVDAKLDTAVQALIPDPSRASWVKTRIGSLVGAEETDEGATQSELFAALLRFFEAMAANRPMILVIEDLQWADPTLVDFIDHLVEWSVDVPILVLGTARPELLDSRPDWGGGRRNSSTLGLSRLSDDDTARLIGSLLGRTVIEAGVQKALLDRCAGNPLYATEFVRYASEKGILDRLTDSLDAMPDSVQALIAARLDLLDLADKEVLQAASVVGRSFWTESVASIRPVAVDGLHDSLRRLALRELIRPIRQPSMEDQEEWAFSHALVNEVAYRQIPKDERRRFHIAVARWMRDVAGDRLSEVAELLAHHYDRVIALSGGELAEELRPDAYAAMFAAGMRIKDLDARRAEHYFDRAIEFAPGPEARALARLERYLSGDLGLDDVITGVQAAIDDAREAKNPELEARAMAELGSWHWYRGDMETNRRLLTEAAALLEHLPASEAEAKILTSLIFFTDVAGKPHEALELAREYRETIMGAGSPEIRARFMRDEANTRLLLDDADALKDSREAINLFLDRNMTALANTSYNNYATYAIFYESAESVASLMDEAIAMCLERGWAPASEFSRMTRFESWFPLGRWDEILADADEIIEADGARGGSKVTRLVSEWKAIISFERNDLGKANKLLSTDVLEVAKAGGDAYAAAGSFSAAILLALANGDTEKGVRIGKDYLDLLVESPEQTWLFVADVAWPLVQAGAADILERMVVHSKGQGGWGAARWAYSKAVLAFAKDDLEAARQLVQKAQTHIEPLGHVYDPILYGILQGRILIELGDTTDAIEVLKDIRVPAKRIRALRLLDQVDELIGMASDAAVESGR